MQTSCIRLFHRRPEKTGRGENLKFPDRDSLKLTKTEGLWGKRTEPSMLQPVASSTLQGVFDLALGLEGKNKKANETMGAFLKRKWGRGPKRNSAQRDCGVSSSQQHIPSWRDAASGSGSKQNGARKTNNSQDSRAPPPPPPPPTPTQAVRTWRRGTRLPACTALSQSSPTLGWPFQ